MIKLDDKTLEIIKKETDTKEAAILSNKYIVIPIKQYKRAKKLDSLYIEFLEDKAQGKVYKSKAKELIKKIENGL